MATLKITILKKLNIDYPVKPIQGQGEHITEMFEADHFDVVYSRNAIDHGDSPSLCIENMYSLLKSGGIFYLAGFVNEGSSNQWEGLHQWDFYWQDEDLMCRSKTGETTNMTKDLPLIAFYNYGPDDCRRFMRAFRKY